MVASRPFLPLRNKSTPASLGSEIARLRDVLPNLKLVGGCCGTNHEHLEEIAKAVAK